MIRVPYIPLPRLHSINDVAPQLFERIPSHPIACANWKEFPYTPKVEVKVAHTPSHLLLRYEVQENSIRARYTQHNQRVWTDSCVEFFASLDGNQTYYNFEFSCIGTPLLRYNVRPREGDMASPQTLNDILTHSSLGKQPIEEVRNGEFSWQLIVAIPHAAFFAHRLTDLKKQTFSANFYKCGDELTEPHYLSLFPIHTPTPNFHTPEFFQPLEFLS
ncbi:MAG: hypothetical protein LBF67_02340 [Prevotellaceae bacterium]|jgi:hypothetical protein|nr:hypothetical protein [Prevotellaceae bacterium]